MKTLKITTQFKKDIKCIGSIDFWRNQSNRKGSNPANGIDPNFYTFKEFYRTAIK